MYALTTSGYVLPLQETDAAMFHDGEVLTLSWDKELLENSGEFIVAQDIASQYRVVLCPKCAILNENDFGWYSRMINRTRRVDHTPVKPLSRQELLALPLLDVLQSIRTHLSIQIVMDIIRSDGIPL